MLYSKSHSRYYVTLLTGMLCDALQGELSLDNERKLHALMRKFETEILAAADVVCVTCIGAGDKRLKRFSFPIVRSPPSCAGLADYLEL